MKQLLRNSRLRCNHGLFSNNKQTLRAMWRKIKSIDLGKQQNPTSLTVLVPINDLVTVFTYIFQPHNNKSIDDYRDHHLKINQTKIKKMTCFVKKLLLFLLCDTVIAISNKNNKENFKCIVNE